jgi:hypothetical protein
MSPLAACLLVGSRWSSSPTSSLFVLKISGAMDRSITHPKLSILFFFPGVLFSCTFLLAFFFPRASCFWISASISTKDGARRRRRRSFRYHQDSSEAKKLLGLKV